MAKNDDSGNPFENGDPRNETTGWSNINLDEEAPEEVVEEVEKPVKQVEAADPEDEEVEEDEQEEQEDEPLEVQPPVQAEVEEEDEADTDEDEKPRKGQRAAKRIRKLVRERNEWQSAYSTAQQAEQELRQELARERQRIAQLEDQTIAAHEARLDAEERQLKVAYKEAEAEGDTDKKLSVQSDLAKIAAYRQQLVGYKTVRANRQPQHQTTQAQQPQQQAGEQRRQLTEAERQAAINSLPPAARKWYLENQWFGKDPDLTAFTNQAGRSIEMEGEVDPDSPEFWSELSRRVSVYKNGGKAPVKKQIRTPVAGGNRTGSQQRKPGKTSVKLSAEDRRMAAEFGMTDLEWAAEKRKAGLA